MASRIAGITVEIGGDTTKLSKALEGVNKSIKTTQAGLKDVNKLLKLDPSNTEAVTQKQRMLKDAIEATKEKLSTLKTAAEQANQQLADGKITQDQYDALQREIVETEQNLKSLQEQAAVTNTTLAKIDAVGEKLQTVGSQVEGVGKKFLPVTAVTGLGTAAVKTVADFDQEMSKVSAIFGATGDDFDQLRAKAREMGAKTKFSASEAASAMEYMAMAGWKTGDIIGYIFMFAWVLLAMFNWLFLCFLETWKLSFLSCIKNLPCLLQLALMLFIFLCAWVVISYNVLSDNYLSFPAYLKIMLRSRFCFNLERNKVKWVYAFLNGNEQDEEIQKHVKKKLEEYSENGYDDFNKKASLLKAKNGKYKKSDIRIFLTHPVLNHVLEQSLMYRVSVPEKLKGSWQDEYYNQRIKLGENIIIDIQGIPYIERPYKDFSFFADTDWGKIKRTGKYTLGEDDKRIHIILKEMNQYDLYMTLCLMEDEKLEVSILFTKHQNGLSVFSSKGDINYRFELIKE